VSTRSRLTQKVDHFTLLESFPSTSCCSYKFLPNKIENIDWLDVWGSIRDVYIGWVVGMYRWEKVTIQNCGTALVKPKNQGLCWLLSGWNEAHSTLWAFGLLKQAATLDIASPDTCQCLKPPFEPFTSPWIHPCYNQPRVSRPKFRLETNSVVVWLYAGGVSLILPDVWLGTVSLDWVTLCT